MVSWTCTRVESSVATLCLIGYVFNGVLVDLSNVTSCDASGLRAIAEADEYLRAQNRSVTLRHAPAHLARLLPSTTANTALDHGSPALS